jgi:hypothetical protein
MGSDVESPSDASSVTLRAVAGVPEVELQLYRDGVPVARSTTGDLAFEADENGVYRVEAYVRASRLGGSSALEPWIIANPIAILPGDQLQARIDANRLPDPDPYDVSNLVPHPLALEAQLRGACTAMDVTGDPQERSFRVGFELGVPEPGAVDTFVEPHGRCIVMDAGGHDLEGYEAIYLEVRADAIHRVNLVLTGSDPDLLTDGIGWTSSFLTYDDWRSVTLPLNRFRGIRNSDPALEDLSALTGLAFLFDTSNTRPGTAGEVEIRNVSLVPIPR